MNQTRKPVIGIICDAFGRDGNNERLFHGVAEEYIRAIIEGTDCTPVLLPSTLQSTADAEAVCQLIDGLLLTGSRTNVHPDRYQGEASKPGTLHDLKRDTSVFLLIDAILKYKLPLLGICRGFQEINVALGGSLHQQLTDLEGRLNHAKYLGSGQHEQYRDSHTIDLTPQGFLEKLLGKSRININSLHYQGVDRLADSLNLEAIAEDGTPEAFRLNHEDHFFVATQWHPEWHIATDPVSQALFKAFGQATYQYNQNKQAR